VIQTFANQVVVDPQHLNVAIGVNIDRQPWRRALELIADQNRLQVWQRETYYELLPVGAGQGAGEVDDEGTTLDSREVNISAIFFQADRAALRELGIDWSTLSGGRVDVTAAHLGASQVVSDQFAVGARANINRSLSVDVLLKAFESNNVGEIVANPQIKVRSGKTGYIQVGSDFSVTTSDFAGNAITKFVSTGTILTVTPKIYSQDLIDFVDLEVEAERSSLVDPVRNLVSKTIARTSTLLRDGEQTAIGGLYGQEISTARTGVPLFKDLPGWFFGLRYLFGTDSKQVRKTELVLLLRVDIVPSIRERAEAQPRERKLYEILEERRKAFDALTAEPKQSLSDTLKTPEPSYGK
ncbi:MAG: type II and III secretion system protein, partial [bacterium]|nr:type II and III secretion system protein [bacterium]